VAWTGLGALVVVVVLFLFPYYIGPGTTGIMVQALIVLTLASMWNLLAGYAGLVSVGQQAFFGLGAYFVLIPAMHGVTPWLGLVIATIAAGVCALPLWWLVSRLRTGYFAIATWVLAAAIMLVVEQIQSIGGGTGEPLPGLTGMDSAVLGAYTYWAALTVAVLAIGGVYFLLRSRVGLVLTAIRDDERAARSSGVRVGTARLLVFVAAAAGCGAAGGVLAIQHLRRRVQRAVDRRDGVRGDHRRHRHDRGADHRHRRLHRAPADAGVLQRLVPDHPRPGRHRDRDLLQARPLGHPRRQAQHRPPPHRLLPMAGGRDQAPRPALHEGGRQLAAQV
jgi:ABC-type branched-subunit amino acid transport system permease subunit